MEGLFQGQSKSLHVRKALLWIFGKGLEYDLFNPR